MAERLRVRLVGWPGRGSQLVQAGMHWQQAMYQVTAALAVELRERAIAESPTGKTPHPGPRFRDSWRTRVQPSYYGGASVTLANVAPHAAFVLGDTRAHEIWAAHLLGTRSATVARTIGQRGTNPQYPLRSPEMGLGYLKFPSRNGGFAFRHMVKHPFHAGNRVDERVDASMQPRYQQLLHDHALDLVARLQSVFSS